MSIAFIVAQVDHDATVRGAVAGPAVPAAADGELDPVLASEGDDGRHVAGVRHPDDRRRSTVDVAGGHGARLVIVRVAGQDDAATEPGSQLGDGDGVGLHGGAPCLWFLYWDRFTARNSSVMERRTDEFRRAAWSSG